MKWMWAAMIACCAIPIAISLSVGGSLGFWFGRSSQQPTKDQPVNQVPPSSISQASPQSAAIASTVSLEPAGNWRNENHIHGLAVNPANPQVIFVATHNGLLQRSASGEWFWVGKQRADYMGFTADLTNPNRFYSSGHPPTGGNLGFQISDTQGENWQQISMPGVDFHALAIAPSDPNVFYGFPASGAQGLHLSIDGGKTWTQSRMTGLGAAPFNLVVNPQNPAHVFAATQAGLYQSTNSGDDWALVPGTQDAPIAGLALLKEGSNTVMLGYRLLQSEPGLYQSVDGGNTWKKLWTETQGIILKVAIAPSNPQILYAANENNQVFQSEDGGNTWRELS
jgi:photosystem II stability/assembly factor-like uncharacterized protein